MGRMRISGMDCLFGHALARDSRPLDHITFTGIKKVLFDLIVRFHFINVSQKIQ